jgi:hypothetical protein
VQIGDSLPAPRFKLVATPNDWAAEVKRSASRSAEPTDAAKLRQSFFESVLEEFKRR